MPERYLTASLMEAMNASGVFARFRSVAAGRFRCEIEFRKTTKPRASLQFTLRMGSIREVTICGT